VPCKRLIRDSAGLAALALVNQIGPRTVWGWKPELPRLYRKRISQAVATGRRTGKSISRLRVTSAPGVMLDQLNIELADSIRPELWERVEQVLADRATRKGAPRRDARRRAPAGQGFQRSGR
jgi:hypothetical protein